MNSDDLAARGVRVKALEWDGIVGSISALSAIGEYVVEEHAGRWGCWNPDQPDGFDPEGWFPSCEAAKAAAQADYTARITSALDEISDASA